MLYTVMIFNTYINAVCMFLIVGRYFVLMSYFFFILYITQILPMIVFSSDFFLLSIFTATFYGRIPNLFKLVITAVYRWDDSRIHHRPMIH